MADQTAQDRPMERVAEVRNGDAHARELPLRRTGADSLAAESAVATAAVSRLAEHATQEIQAALLAPNLEVQEAFGSLLAGAMRHSVQLVDGFWKVQTPQDVLGLQQRLLHQWMDTALAGQALMLRVGLQAADAALRPAQRQP